MLCAIKSQKVMVFCINLKYDEKITKRQQTKILLYEMHLHFIYFSLFVPFFFYIYAPTDGLLVINECVHNILSET